MAISRIESLDNIGEVKVTKKTGLKRISMRLHHSGQIRVSIPYYLPYAVGFSFAKSQADWIGKTAQKQSTLKLYNDMQIGKGYKLLLIQSDRLSSRVKTSEIIVNYPKKYNANDLAVVNEAKKAIKRALIKEAKELLPDRATQLAETYGYSYSEIITKPMKTRWGSCSTKKLITLNCYLLMMPWPIIDYVIMHELSHTKHMNHSSKFWEEVAKTTPNYKDLKKTLKQIQPDIHALYI